MGMFDKQHEHVRGVIGQLAGMCRPDDPLYPKILAGIEAHEAALGAKAKKARP